MERRPLKVNTVTVFFFLWIFLSLCHQGMLDNVVVDMTNQQHCSSEREIRDDQVFSVMASYRPNLQPSMDHCDFSIRTAESNRRLEYLIDRLTFTDCGVKIWLYDNPQTVSHPTRIIECSDDTKLPLTGKTSHGVIKISLRKESTQAIAFEFQIRVKTDYGPPFEFEKDAADFYEQPLDTGAIVGIVIAGSVLIIAVAGLAIYCCLKARMNNRKYAEASDNKSAPPSSVYTTGSSKVGYQPGKPRSFENGGPPRPTPSQDSRDRSSSPYKGDRYDGQPPRRDTAYKEANNVYSDRGHNYDSYPNRNYNHANQTYENEKLDRQAPARTSQRRWQNDAPFDDYADVKGDNFSRRDSGRGSQRKQRQQGGVPYDDADTKGGHISRRDSSRGSNRKRQDALYDDPDSKGGHISRKDSSRGSSKRKRNNDNDESGGHVSRRDSGKSNKSKERIKYNKKTNYSRSDDYGSVGRAKKRAADQRRARSRSPSLASLGSTVDSNVLVYGYSRTSAQHHPNNAEDRDPRSRSRSASRSRKGPGSHRSGGSISRSRTGSVGRSDSRPRGDSRDGRPRGPPPKNMRQYGDMTAFLPEQDRHRSRSQSAGSVGRSNRR